jgi:hypothetical protein
LFLANKNYEKKKGKRTPPASPPRRSPPGAAFFFSNAKSVFAPVKAFVTWTRPKIASRCHKAIPYLALL